MLTHSLASRSFIYLLQLFTNYCYCCCAIRLVSFVWLMDMIVIVIIIVSLRAFRRVVF